MLKGIFTPNLVPFLEDGRIKWLWVQVTNPGQTIPNRQLLIEPGVKDPDKFLIVSDVYPTATTAIADERPESGYVTFRCGDPDGTESEVFREEG